MSEGYPAVRNFWDDLDKAFHEWAYFYMDTFDNAADHSYYLIGDTIKHSDNTKPNISIAFSCSIHIAYENSYCSMHFHAQNCTQCDDLCGIQNLEPCRKIWTGLSEECCQTCDLFAGCEVDECLIQSTTLPLTSNTTSLSNSNNGNFRGSKSFYVLVTLLPICGFIGRGSY